MKLLAVSDLHGDLQSVWTALEAAEPDVLLCCGDWGDPGEVDPEALQAFTERLPVYTVFGNHDDLQVLEEWENRDGSPVLLPQGGTQQVGALVLAGISGIWAKSHRKPYYVTDEDVDEAALRVQASGARVDILLSHGCPSGVADLAWGNRHAGQRCFLRAFQLLRPRLYLTGHLHRAQEHRTHSGEIVRNVGATPTGDAVLITVNGRELEVTALRLG
ncbi:MAG: metallophosphoesterase [Armatimonadota bacterium]